MKNIEIYEPAMCCSTGLCGVSVDPELLRISTVLNTLEKKGITIKRYNLTNAPMEFVNNKVVNDFIKQYGTEKLPLTVVDGKPALFGRYPGNELLAQWCDMTEDALGEQETSGGCCCEGGCC